jgi:hypothetical protein
MSSAIMSTGMRHPISAVGVAVHQAATWAGSQVASFMPLVVSGALSAGDTGNTSNPAAA